MQLQWEVGPALNGPRATVNLLLNPLLILSERLIFGVQENWLQFLTLLPICKALDSFLTPHFAPVYLLISSFIHSLNIYCLSIFYVTGTSLGSWESSVEKTEKFFGFRDVYHSMRGTK